MAPRSFRTYRQISAWLRRASEHGSRAFCHLHLGAADVRRTAASQGPAWPGSSGSVQALTSTVRVPRSSMTSTVVPLGSASGDQAMNASEPPRILTRTSPGPALPRVATVTTPMQPMADTFATMPRRSSYPPDLNPQGSPARDPPGPWRSDLITSAGSPGDVPGSAGVVPGSGPLA